MTARNPKRLSFRISIEMTPEQVEDYCVEYGSDPADLREDIQSYILTMVQGCAAGQFWEATIR